MIKELLEGMSIEEAEKVKNNIDDFNKMMEDFIKLFKPQEYDNYEALEALEKRIEKIENQLPSMQDAVSATEKVFNMLREKEEKNSLEITKLIGKTSNLEKTSKGLLEVSEDLTDTMSLLLQIVRDLAANMGLEIQIVDEDSGDDGSLC